MVDLATIERAQAGDADALDTLIRATYNYVKGYLVRKATNYDYAEEATQETYIAMLDALPKSEVNSTALTSWLCGIAWRKLAHIERRERRRAGPMLRADMAANDSVERQVLDRMAAQQVRNVLALLTPYRRAILELRFVHGLDIPDVAAVLDISPRQASYAAYSGLKELRGRIQNEAHYETRSDAVLEPTRRNNSGRPLASRKQEQP